MKKYQENHVQFVWIGFQKVFRRRFAVKQVVLETFVTVQGIIRPVLIASTLTWFIIYIYICNLHFLNNEHIIKNNVNIPQTWVT